MFDETFYRGSFKKSISQPGSIKYKLEICGSWNSMALLVQFLLELDLDLIFRFLRWWPTIEKILFNVELRLFKNKINFSNNRQTNENMLAIIRPVPTYNKLTQNKHIFQNKPSKGFGKIKSLYFLTRNLLDTFLRSDFFFQKL